MGTWAWRVMVPSWALTTDECIRLFQIDLRGERRHTLGIYLPSPVQEYITLMQFDWLS